MSKIAITDYFLNAEEEAKVLGKLVGTEVGEDTEVLLVWHEHIDEEFVKKCPNLRAVQRYGVGYDTLDIDYLKKKGIIACNNPDYGIDEVSDTAIAMIMNIVRGILLYDATAKSFTDTWQENVNPLLRRNSETMLGVIGAGRIGGSVLLKARALRFKTVFFDPYKERGYEKMLGAQRVESIEELLSLSDIVSLHCPLNKTTRGLVDKIFLDSMKEGASLVNTARGGLLSETDSIYEALKSGKLAQCALDVLINEPPKEEKLIAAWRNQEDFLKGRLLINPHTSYYSQESYKEIRTNAAKNALRLYRREVPYNIL
jgi:D-3-phosphoglycerate dehydrogenase